MGTNSDYKEHNQQQLRKQWATEDWFKQQSQKPGGGGGPAGCFPGETQVLTRAGSVPIASVSVGDLVASVDRRTGQSFYRQVLAKKVYRSARLWKIVLASDETPLVATRAHAFLTGRGWVRVSALRAGDALRRADGGSNVVVGISDSQRYSRVYNLITEKEHTFFADGYAAHNFTYLRQVRMWAYSLLRSARRLERLLSQRPRIVSPERSA